MLTSKRVAFTIDDRSLAVLEEIQRRGRYESMAYAIREGLRILRTLQFQANDGFKEVIVRNPTTGDERILLVPHLESA